MKNVIWCKLALFFPHDIYYMNLAFPHKKDTFSKY